MTLAFSVVDFGSKIKAGNHVTVELLFDVEFGKESFEIVFNPAGILPDALKSISLLISPYQAVSLIVHDLKQTPCD